MTPRTRYAEEGVRQTDLARFRALQPTVTIDAFDFFELLEEIAHLRRMLTITIPQFYPPTESE